MNTITSTLITGTRAMDGLGPFCVLFGSLSVHGTQVGLDAFATVTVPSAGADSLRCLADKSSIAYTQEKFGPFSYGTQVLFESLFESHAPGTEKGPKRDSNGKKGTQVQKKGLKRDPSCRGMSFESHAPLSKRGQMGLKHGPNGSD